jgi:hypothetical protein
MHGSFQKYVQVQGMNVALHHVLVSYDKELSALCDS